MAEIAIIILMNTCDFRAAMDLPLQCNNEAVLRAALHALMQELLANSARRHDPRLQSMLVACRLRLRALQNLVDATKSEQNFTLWRCDLRSMLEDLCAAADLLLSPFGRFVKFDAPPALIEAACSPRDIAWLVLELICNAVRHTHGEEIAVALSLKKSRAHRKPTACVITVESEGGIDLAKLHKSASQQGSGASAMLRTAWLHKAALLWLERNSKVHAALRMSLWPNEDLYRVPRSDKKPGDLPLWEPPDLVELLSDQCSQIYVALAQVCG